ncbi:MAG TPA: glutamate--tRNA ligase family protein [Candidatus Paceibacterota bacterium]
MFGSKKPIVRIAPSPTGNLHVGTARTALFNYLFARNRGGKFLVRIEDTDLERSKKEYEENILKSFKWLGMEYDGELMRQSERTEIYQKHAQILVGKGMAREDGTAIILNNSKKEMSFQDLIRGEIKFEDVAEEVVLIKSDGTPTYNFAVVVDDAEMKVTHVIRGEDHISNTPRQLVIMEALGFERPLYAHIPMILAPDRSKLSKRYGAVSLLEYREKGYLPQAMLNYLALLGWNPGTDQEIFTIDELIKEFSLEKIQKSGAIFDEKKLEWVNKEHIKRLPEEVQKEMRLKEVGELPYIKQSPELDPKFICWKAESKENTREYLEKVKTLLSDPAAIMKYAETVGSESGGRGKVLWPLRYALSGEHSSPDPFTLLDVLGQEEAKNRIENAIKVLSTED